MPYEFRVLQFGDIDFVYSAAETNELGHLMYRKHGWPKDMHHTRWAVDRERRRFLVLLPWTRDDSTMRYLFGQDGAPVIISNVAYGQFAILHLSPALKHRVDEVMQSMREALREGGLWLDGNLIGNELFAVPDAQFTMPGPSPT